eukprot:6180452-Pleurochrysis_carterae.AAC.1
MLFEVARPNWDSTYLCHLLLLEIVIHIEDVGKPLIICSEPRSEVKSRAICVPWRNSRACAGLSEETPYLSAQLPLFCVVIRATKSHDLRSPTLPSVSPSFTSIATRECECSSLPCLRSVARRLRRAQLPCFFNMECVLATLVEAADLDDEFDGMFDDEANEAHADAVALRCGGRADQGEGRG